MTGRSVREAGQARPQPHGYVPKRGRVDFPVVAMGASAGGLDTFRKFFDALPVNNGMAFVLIQHLDPTHESLMVDLLTGHTPMKVLQAADGMQLERDHVYLMGLRGVVWVNFRAYCNAMESRIVTGFRAGVGTLGTGWDFDGGCGEAEAAAVGRVCVPRLPA